MNLSACARIAGDLYLNSGDAHTRQVLDRDKIFRYGKHVSSPLMVALAAGDLPADYVPRTVTAIFNEDALRAEPPQTAPLLKDVWLPSKTAPEPSPSISIQHCSPPQSKTITLDNPGLMSVWGNTVYRVLLKSTRPLAGGESTLLVRAL